MTAHRVVVTGVGLVSPLGNALDTAVDSLVGLRHGIARADEWAAFGGLEARLCGKAKPYAIDSTRKQLRNMGPVAQMSIASTRAAFDDSGLDESLLRTGKVTLVFGSTDGSTSAAEDYYRKLYTTNNFGGLLSSTYLKFMSHTCAANVAQVMGITGRVLPVCSACTSASQAIGEGYWSIASGRDEIAICGGAEEAHASVAGVFDLMLATSLRYNDRPELTPRPFDAERDGMVVAEGAGTLVLESYEHARKRDARIYGEIVGYGNNCDGQHLTSPSPGGMAGAMRRALESAQLRAEDIDYINAHGTGTEIGDVAESKATMEVMGDKVPISSTKSYTGHTLGACGAIESIFLMGVLRDEFLPPTRNLDRVDPSCAPLNYIVGDVRRTRPRFVMNNNFAFGGINTSLIFARL